MVKLPPPAEIAKQIKIVEFSLLRSGIEVAYDFCGQERPTIYKDPLQVCQWLEAIGEIDGYRYTRGDLLIDWEENEHEWYDFVSEYSFTENTARKLAREEVESQWVSGMIDIQPAIALITNLNKAI